ncbi:P-loop containing nucleoside triphosphate hydrolase protein, partial [Pseudovirgaria hyperparasitica]
MKPPSRKRVKTERARRILSGGAAGPRDTSDDESAAADAGWTWIYGEPEEEEDTLALASSSKAAPAGAGSSRKRKAPDPDLPALPIVGAQKGNVHVKVGDPVVLKGTQNEVWIGIVQELFQDDDANDMMAKLVWFHYPEEVRNKTKRRTDALANEIYISSASDVNSLETINGHAKILSPGVFNARYPTGVIGKRSKDYGRVFVCRRGVTVRTATYTEEFIWEKVYKGAEDLEPLLDLVTSQTKPTRKRAPAKAKKESYVYDDFVADEDDDDDDEPKTPRKRQKLKGAATPTSARKARTPSKNFLTPTHKRIVVKKPLEFTPLGTRVLSPSALSSPFQLARSQLHVSSVPATLPCREEEFSTVYSHLEAAITDGSGSCIYISGTPGTGKTATVREVVAQLNTAVVADELDDFIFVEINGMKVTDPHQSYSLLWEALKGDRVSPSQALDLLEREFSSPSPRRIPCVVLMDELDQLVTKNQSVMYNFFNWPSLRHARLIVLAVANTMDLPERTLSNKISSRLGLTRITFPGYTHDQLMQIIHSRLSNVPDHIVHPDAVQFAARKVAAVSGDARRALDICRRAVELAEAEDAASTSISAPDDPATPLPAKKVSVTIATIKRAIAEATSSPLQQYLRALPLASKLFLAALLARVRRSGVGEALLGDV